MIIIFSFIFLFILISLLYLSQQGKISRNIPIAFVVVLLLSSPFLYLARKENFTNPTLQTSDIFYTNQPPEKQQSECEDCAGMCDNTVEYDVKRIDPKENIDNPLQSQIVTSNVTPLNVSVYAASNSQGNGFTANLSYNGKTMARSLTQNGIYVLPISVKELTSEQDFFNGLITYNPDMANLAGKMIKDFDSLEDETFIIIGTSGSNLWGLLNSKPRDLINLNEKYQLKMINKLQNGDSYAAIIFKKSENDYVDVVQQLSPKSISNGVLLENIQLLKPGTKMTIETKGKEIPSETQNYPSDFPPSRAVYVEIKPNNSNKDFNLVFSVEKNQSFVYLSPPVVDSIYSESPEKLLPVSTTILESRKPQKWTLEPVFNTAINNQYYIKTYDRPLYYLEVDTTQNPPKLKVNYQKSGFNQQFTITPSKTDYGAYKILNEKTGLYLGYNDFGGYLYQDNGNVSLVESDKYTWKFIESEEKKPNMKAYNKIFSFTDFTSPNDFPTESNAVFNLATKINGQRINLSSSGKSPWNSYYTPIWNGDWIYYGTIRDYTKSSSSGGKVRFLTVRLNNDGEGLIFDPYFGARFNVKNAGSNYLIGTVNDGKFKDYMAFLQFLPSDLKFQGGSNTYPVLMRYLVIKDVHNIYNLSGADMNNLNGYSMKFDGRKPGINSMLAMQGIITNTDIGFPK